MADPIGSDLRAPRYLDYPYHLSGTGLPNTIASGRPVSGVTGSGTYDEHLRDLILQVLFTNPGERVNLPEFGVGVQRLVFAPNSDALRATSQFLISTNLQRWLGDRIDVEQVLVASEPGLEEAVTIDVVYTVKRTRQRERVQVQV